MKDFRGPLPLTDADFARIRANVLAEVRPKRKWLAFRWAFATLTAAAFVGVVSYKSLQVTTPTLPPRQAPPAPKANINVEEILRQAQDDVRANPPRRAHTRKRVETPEPAPQLRIEIQTSDPDIRIIWLPNQYDLKSEEQS